MVNDIVPGLLESIQNEFKLTTEQDVTLKKLLLKLDDKNVTYIDAQAYAVKIGEILSNVLEKNVRTSQLPDGRMYYNIAERILNPTLKENYKLVSDYGETVQTILNENAGIHLKAQVPKVNQDRINGLINRISSEESFNDIKWIIDKPVVTFSQSVIDDMIEANAEFHHKAGLKPTITRTLHGRACKWCRSLAGTYTYPNVPADVYRRHDNCTCTVEYDPGTGRHQNVWTKQWN